MVRLLILISALVLLAAGIGRWWFWSRVRQRGRRIECSLTVDELYRRLGVEKHRAGDLRDAAALGNALRDAGLRLLEQDGMSLARKRRTGWWNLRILPLLVVLVLVFSAFTTRVPTRWVLGIGCVLVALHVVLRVSGIGVELRAVRRGWEELERCGGVRRLSEEQALLECARASVWDTVLPW